MKDTRGYWMGDYWGAISIGYNANLVSTPPKSFADLLKSEYKGKVALNGSPLTSNSAVAGVFAAALANGGSLSNVGPGIDWFAKLKQVGNFIPVQTTPQTVASGQTPISIDWDYNNFAYVKEFPAANWKVVLPTDGVVRRLLLPGGQRDRPAPVRRAAVAGVHLLRPGADPVPEGVRASRPVHRHGRAEGDPEVAGSTLSRRLASTRSRSSRASARSDGGEERSSTPQWPAKVGSG